ncbi:MAG: hypothetical protein F4Y25_08525 [Chloroflexi bacterium]|nr:hypothetical protein [Chloroflexota bacterium]
MDINNYTNDLLLDFLDAFHNELVRLLKLEYGDRWLETGVSRHFNPEYFARTEEMLSSPMRAVDMPREPEELYGVEHLAKIVDGNRKIFRPLFQDIDRTRVYLGEIAELRHNLAHRRRRHLVRLEDLIRFTQNARRLLEAVGSTQASHFSSVVDALAQGGKPWGTPLGGRLPHLDEIYDEFIGRPEQLRNLGAWFMDDAKPIVIWGYGGAGKSALAYKFAKEVQESAPDGFDAVIWLTAKRLEFVEGTTRQHVPDFTDTFTFCKSIWEGLYGDVPNNVLGDNRTEQLIDELNKTKCLIIVDDLDTVLDDVETADFLLHELRACKSSILYTSRQQVQGLRYIEVPGFEGDELLEFIRQRGLEYKLDAQDACNRATAIASVTGGYPLFVDDLLRYSILVGMDDAIQDWKQRQGDAAREYALSRQLAHLQKEGVGGKVLKGVAASRHPLTLAEIGKLVGVTDLDAEAGVRNLLKWHLLYRAVREEDNVPAFSMNGNTRRLTELVFKSDPEYIGMCTAVATLTGERIPEAKRKAIATAISYAQKTLRANGIDSAAGELRSRMTGELAHSADLHGALGWIYSQPGGVSGTARECFEEACKLGSQHVETYLHWIDMEKRIAEQAVKQIPERNLLTLWENAMHAVEMALGKCGEIDILFQQAGYIRSRQAGTYDHLNEFALAQGAHRTAVEWFERSLEAPSHASVRISRYQVYRGLAISFAGLNDQDGLVRAINNWRTLARDYSDFVEEVRRITNKVPGIERRLPWIYDLNQ